MQYYHDLENIHVGIVKLISPDKFMNYDITGEKYLKLYIVSSELYNLLYTILNRLSIVVNHNGMCQNF